MRLEARLSYALIGLVQATGYAGGLDWTIPADNFLSISARFTVLYNRPVKKKTR